MNSLSSPGSARLTPVQWLICIIAAIGFAFDTYVLLMMPLIARPALAELLGVDPNTQSGNAAVLYWTGIVNLGPAILGGIFGLLGGYLTDRLGRRRVLTWSILLYAFSSVASGFSTSVWMLFVFRCTTFIGVCVEFVAAVAWVAELFADPKQRETVLGFTQAFASVGGLLVTSAYALSNRLAGELPTWASIYGDQKAWRYALISGIIPALPLIIIRPFLPESPSWRAKKVEGKLKRPSIAELFRGTFRRTTIVTTILFACAFGAAFGAIQLTPQIVPGLVPESATIQKLRAQLDKATKGSPEYAKLKEQLDPLQRTQQAVVASVQFRQEIGGLLGRFALAWLALVIVRRAALLRFFQVPGLIIVPLVFFFPAAGNMGEQSLEWLKWGIALAGFFTIAQFSFWGNYLPRVYPTYLRGTGESFAANIGGRMIGTSFMFLTTQLAPLVVTHFSTTEHPLKIPTGTAYAAGGVALVVYAVGVITSFWLPEPSTEALPE
jgi:MFS family permease